MKYLLYGVLGLVGLALLSLATGAWTYITAPFFGRVQAERQLESGPSRITFYDRFHDLCAGVQAVEGQIDAQRTLLASLDKGTPDYTRTAQNIAGLEARRSQVIAQYNADASKDYTAARFKDADLPWQLSSAPYAGTKTSCAP